MASSSPSMTSRSVVRSSAGSAQVADAACSRNPGARCGCPTPPRVASVISSRASCQRIRRVHPVQWRRVGTAGRVAEGADGRVRIDERMAPARRPRPAGTPTAVSASAARVRLRRVLDGPDRSVTRAGDSTRPAARDESLHAPTWPSIATTCSLVRRTRGLRPGRRRRCGSAPPDHQPLTRTPLVIPLHARSAHVWYEIAPMSLGFSSGEGTWRLHSEGQAEVPDRQLRSRRRAGHARPAAAGRARPRTMIRGHRGSGRQWRARRDVPGHADDDVPVRSALRDTPSHRGRQTSECRRRSRRRSATRSPASSCCAAAR